MKIYNRYTGKLIRDFCIKNFSCANFTGTDLREADLSGTDRSWTDFTRLTLGELGLKVLKYKRRI